jgi:hypothetical protein
MQRFYKLFLIILSFSVLGCVPYGYVSYRQPIVYEHRYENRPYYPAPRYYAAPIPVPRYERAPRDYNPPYRMKEHSHRRHGDRD